MKMNNPFVVGFYNVFWQQHSIGEIFAYDTGNIVPLRTIDNCIFVAVFFIALFITAVDEFKNSAICRIPYNITAQ